MNNSILKYNNRRFTKIRNTSAKQVFNLLTNHVILIANIITGKFHLHLYKESLTNVWNLCSLKEHHSNRSYEWN